MVQAMIHNIFQKQNSKVGLEYTCKCRGTKSTYTMKLDYFHIGNGPAYQSKDSVLKLALHRPQGGDGSGAGW